MKKILAYLIIVFFNGVLHANPFMIDFPEKKELTNDDYIEIQKKIKAINIIPLLQELYVEDIGLTSFDDFKSRCTKALRQNLIDPEKNCFPQKKLIKIGRGGDSCIVNCCPYNLKYPELVNEIPQTLSDLGFNGYFYYLVGGCPNPTGKEVKYVGVPYSFKIFMMLEAQQIGFTKVLWLDSAILPLKDPTPIFAKIEQEGCFLLHEIIPGYDQRYILPKTRQLLKDLTGTDVVGGRHISTQVFGLKMDTEKTKKFVNAYYKMLELGTPFLSCYPEEFVYVSIFQQSEKDWPSQHLFSVLRFQGSQDIQSEAKILKETNLYFLLRHH
jgi:hypothetical protein